MQLWPHTAGPNVGMLIKYHMPDLSSSWTNYWQVHQVIGIQFILVTMKVTVIVWQIDFKLWNYETICHVLYSLIIVFKLWNNVHTHVIECSVEAYTPDGKLVWIIKKLDFWVWQFLFGSWSLLLFFFCSIIRSVGCSSNCEHTNHDSLLWCYWRFTSHRSGFPSLIVAHDTGKKWYRMWRHMWALWTMSDILVWCKAKTMCSVEYNSTSQWLY